MSDDSATNEMLVTLTADIVAAHVSNSSNSVAIADVPTLISNVHAALSSLGAPAAPEPVKQDPAVSIRSSVKPDHIVCLEDGVKLKMLKRHLMTHHGLTIPEYKAKWGLAADYPVTAPNYAAKRRDLAKKIGLGRKPGTKVVRKAAPKAAAKKAPAKKAPAKKR